MMSKKEKTAANSFVARVHAEGQISRDMGMLRDLCGALTEQAAKAGPEGKVAAGHLSVFADILDRMENGKQQTLSDKQRVYMEGVFLRHCKGETYENAWSAGKVERGKEVELPTVLRPENLPKFPPGRRPTS